MYLIGSGRLVKEAEFRFNPVNYGTVGDDGRVHLDDRGLRNVRRDWNIWGALGGGTALKDLRSYLKGGGKLDLLSAGAVALCAGKDFYDANKSKEKIENDLTRDRNFQQKVKKFFTGKE